MSFFQVERILEKRVDKGGYTEYLVKWRNYDVRRLSCILTSLNQTYLVQDPEENTWEPLENLAEAEKAIKLFEKEQVTSFNLFTSNPVFQDAKNQTTIKSQGQGGNKRKYSTVVQQVGPKCAITNVIVLLRRLYIFIVGQGASLQVCSGGGQDHWVCKVAAHTLAPTHVYYSCS